MSTLGIAGLQLDLDKGNNLARLGDEVAAARKRLPWVDVIVLSELCSYGTDPRHAEPEGGAAEQEFRRVARECGVWLLPGTLFQQRGPHIYNVCPVIDPQGTVIARYSKMFPFCPYERGITPGDAFCLFDIPGVARIGVAICYDVWFPEVTRTLAWMGAEVVLCPSLTNTIDREVEVALVRGNAAANQVYFANINGAGRLALGRSVVCGPGGEVVHQAGVGREVIACELDLEYVKRVRARGWHGLAQTLKSFRDAPVLFPPYQPGARSATLDALGPVELAQSNNRT